MDKNMGQEKALQKEVPAPQPLKDEEAGGAVGGYLWIPSWSKGEQKYGPDPMYQEETN